MSTLISRLGRRFREKKPKSSTNLDLPGLPSPREILEDIESCQSGDPIIGLATLIQRKGRQSTLLDKDFFLEDPSITSQENLAFLAPYQTSVAVSPGGGGGDKTGVGDDNKSGGGSAQHKRRPSLTLVSGGGSSKTKSKSTSDAEYLNSYNKLKQFLLLFEKSEEILESLEPHFRRVENSARLASYGGEDDEKEVKDSMATTLTTASSSSTIKIKLNDGGDILKVEAAEESEEEFDKRGRQLSESSDACSSPLL